MNNKEYTQEEIDLMIKHEKNKQLIINIISVIILFIFAAFILNGGKPINIFNLIDNSNGEKSDNSLNGTRGTITVDDGKGNKYTEIIK